MNENALYESISRLQARTVELSGEVSRLGDQMQRLAEQNRALRKDAERYRWLRSEDVAADPRYYEFWREFSIKLCRETAMDAAIDAAMTPQSAAASPHTAQRQGELPEITDGRS